MATSTRPRIEYLQALPTYAQAASMIEIDPTGIGRAVAKLGITPLAWGGREKRLQIVDVLRIAQRARRASVDEVAGSLMDAAERDHPELVEQIDREIAHYFDEIHPQPDVPGGFLQEMRAALPPEHAQTVERIYRRYATSS